MASKRLAVVADGKTTPIESEQEELDFLSVRFGPSKLKLSEVDGTTATLNGKKLRVTAGTHADDVTNKAQLDAVQSQVSLILAGGVITDFDVGVGGQSQFAIGTISPTSYIEVRINGVEKREGATHDYERNVGASRIDMNFTVPQNAWVRVKVFP